MHPSRTATYGPEYEQLLLAAHAQPAFRFPLETPGKARIMKAKIYGYFRALREENLRLDLIEMADQLSLTITDNLIVFSKKADAWDSAAIRNVLGLSESFNENGNTGSGELHVPDLLQNRLVKRIAEIRDRQSGAVAKITKPHKSSK